jgi:cytochrome c oxidase cbb3-type subunit III
MRGLLFIFVAASVFAQLPGKRAFDAQCAPCHGMGGAGGRGPNLAVLRRVTTDEALLGLIRKGIPGTEMPEGWMLSENELLDVTAYVRSLGTVAPEQVSGDAERGRQAYGRADCANCHVVRGQGQAYGPELSGIGGRRSAAYLREALEKPGATVPEGFLMVRVVPKAGKPAEGIRLNEDSFTIQLLDPARRLHSFRKMDLARLDKLSEKSPMPPYRGTDVDDLVAYLISLRAAQ